MIPRVLEPEAMETTEEVRQYDAMDHGAVNSRFVDDFLAAHGPCRGGEVLDVGTGTGRLAGAIRERSPAARVVGADFALGMLRAGDRTIDFVQADGLRLPFADDTFDAVTSAFVSFELADTGYRELRFSVEPKQGEHELANNTRTRVVQVAARKASVLYVEGEPRWELKFMRRALEHDAGVRLVSWLHTSPNGYYRQGVDEPDELKAGFPTDRPGLFRYDAIIIPITGLEQFRDTLSEIIRLAKAENKL